MVLSMDFFEGVNTKERSGYEWCCYYCSDGVCVMPVINLRMTGVVMNLLRV